ncbi:MAG TPA: hypothetical protein VKU79_04585, partial [Thermoplasmataceae archaeon]|nr:hypothetical protein [Thermoplasmataceae archaeon]
VFTGDVLMVGDVGRPDLVETPEETDQLCMALYRSLEKLKSLPDHVELYPSHFGGSHCGSIFLSKKKWSTIGYEKRSNRFLQADSWESLRNAVLKYRTKPPEDIKVILRENMR